MASIKRPSSQSNPAVPSPLGKPGDLSAMPPGLTPEQAAQFQAFQAFQASQQVPTSAATGAGIVPTAPKTGMVHVVRKINQKTGNVTEKTIPSLAALQAFGALTINVLAPDGKTVASYLAEPDQNGSGSWGYGVNGQRLVFQTPGGPASLVVSINLTQSDSKPPA